MSQWHREHPELVGTDADPWMQHDSYRKALPTLALAPADEAPCPTCHGEGWVTVPGYSLNPSSGVRVVDPQCEHDERCPSCRESGLA